MAQRLAYCFSYVKLQRKGLTQKLLEAYPSVASSKAKVRSNQFVRLARAEDVQITHQNLHWLVGRDLRDED